MTTFWPALAATILFNVVAQVLLKFGADRPPISTIFPLSVVNWYTVAGAACFGAALVAYVFLLRRIPLIVAQSMLSLQFVAVVAVAAIVFGERLAPLNWAGIGLIAAGLFLLSR